MIDPKTKAKITWNCRRGMLELDLLLSSYLQKELEQLDSARLVQFEALLENQDPDLYAWLMGYEQPPEDFGEIVQHIRNFHTVK